MVSEGRQQEVVATLDDLLSGSSRKSFSIVSQMPDTLPSHFLDLVANALLHSFWRKSALSGFLRRMNLKESFLSSWQEGETKRELIYRMFPYLERTDAGRQALQTIASELATQTSFPDLAGWEDSLAKKARAAEAVLALKT